jgi:hypothetical protein
VGASRTIRVTARSHRSVVRLDPNSSKPGGAKHPLEPVREMYELTKDIRLIRWLCNAAGGFHVANRVPELRKSLDET